MLGRITTLSGEVLVRSDQLRHYAPKKPQAPDDGMILAGVSSQPAGKTRDGWYATVFANCLKNDNKSFEVGSQTVEGVDPSNPLFCHLGFDFPHTPVLAPADYANELESGQLSEVWF